MVNEMRAGFFRNRNDSMAVRYFTNAEFGIQNPFADQVPDLTQITIDGDDVGGELRFGTLGDGTRIFDRQTTWTAGNTLSLVARQPFVARGRRASSKLAGRRSAGNTEPPPQLRLVDGFHDRRLCKSGRSQSRTADCGYRVSIVGSTVRNYRMTDWSWFLADDWKLTSNLTLNVGVRHDFYGFPSEQNGFLALYDFPAALATGNVQDGFVFASNFDPTAVPGAAGLNLNISSRKSIVPSDYNNLAPRIGFAWQPSSSGDVVVRGGWGLFYERVTGAFANSLRQGPPFFRELQLNDAGNWNTIPNDVPTFPVPNMRVGFDDGEPILVGDNDPDTEFEAFETQMVSSDLLTPYMHQWNLTTQWEFRPNWLLEAGYVGSKGSKLLQWANLNQAIDVETVGLLRRPGVPGGGFTGNYFEVDDDEFVTRDTPPAGCIDDDPGDCVIPGELRGPLLGLDEDEGANFLSNGGRSRYHSMQLSLQRRFNRGYMFNVNYTLSKSMDTYSDEGVFQIEHDQSRPELNWALSDFDRRHRVIFSWVWELPFSGNRWAEGWQISGVGTVQSGRPFTITDDDYSGFLYASQNPRPSLASGKTLDDQTTSGSVTVAAGRVSQSRRVRELGRAVRHAAAQLGNRAGTAAARRQLLEDDQARGPRIDRATARGVQRDQHAGVPESGQRSRLLEFRSDYAHARRPAPDSTWSEAAVLIDAARCSLIALLLCVAGCAASGGESPAPLEPVGRTAKVPNDPDDPAIWIHPSDPSKSLDPRDR